MKSLIILLSFVGFLYAQDTVQIQLDTIDNGGSLTNVITSYNANKVINSIQIDYKTKDALISIDSYIFPFVSDSTGKISGMGNLMQYHRSDMSVGMKAACDTLCLGFKKILKKAIILKSK